MRSDFKAFSDYAILDKGKGNGRGLVSVIAFFFFKSLCGCANIDVLQGGRLMCEAVRAWL